MRFDVAIQASSEVVINLTNMEEDLLLNVRKSWGQLEAEVKPVNTEDLGWFNWKVNHFTNSYSVFNRIEAPQLNLVMHFRIKNPKSLIAHKSSTREYAGNLFIIIKR